MRFGTIPPLSLAGLCLALALASPAARAEPSSRSADGQRMYDLQSVRRQNEITRVEALLEVTGQLKLTAGDRIETVPLAVKGKTAYDEKLLDGDPNHLTSLRSLRYYHQIEAEINVDKGVIRPELPAQRRLIGAVLHDDRPILYSPDGSLTRDELDLLELPGNSLLVEALLPDHPVKLGDSWQHDSHLLAGLLNIEAISANDVKSELVDVSDGFARIETSGHVNGAIHGVATELELKAKLKYDLSLQRIVWVALVLKEQRSIGHVDPGLEVVARLQMKLSPHVASERLDPAALKLTRQAFDVSDTLLTFESFAAGFSLRYPRTWFVINEEPELVVMRLVDRGELLAQCNISLSGSRDVPPLAKFQQDIQRSLGDNFGQFVRAAQSVNDRGYVVYRVIVAGVASDLPIQWNYYLVSDGAGNSLVLLFTLEESLVERFGSADEELVSSVQFLGRPDDGTTAQPTPAQPRR